ncbi:A/G-specific adenine glycosylase [Paenalcaligenes faecalis]|uniref:A/G-specific adenine glycosylase n=1 Tax=Paenalcaligenes faecalis TaxID=2980099 RepID=UPI0022B94B8C|nr:A/G-specific adenine glycosylase [Paenalcaligenes faecalis]
MKKSVSSFAQSVVDWQLSHGRQHLPWQHTKDPYRIWLSEIMLQQTQVATVLGYYERFLARFPTVSALGVAEQSEVMPYWAGLGYYARARNLHKCAQTIHYEYGGQFPRSSKELATLSGIGPSTAAAIAAFAYGERSPIMDGNVKRVFCRYFGVYGLTHLRATENKLWDLARQVIAAAPADLNMTAYTQGQMDLGSQVCTRGQPNCSACPLQAGCYALEHQTQTELPTPKPKTKQAERHCDMLIWQQGNQILVEQRPDSGIWGGLLTLPQFEDESQLQQFILNQGLSLNETHKMAGLTHVFSHFKLHITPWWIQTSTPLREPSVQQQWIDLTQLDQTALPAPVLKLLTGIKNQQPILF